MKKVKNLFVVLMVLVFVLPVMLTSCGKKGENDPGLSLRSRTSRLTGVWKLIEGTETQTSTSNSSTVTYTGSLATGSYGGQSYSYAYTEEIEFTKDNTFKITIMEDTDLISIEGFWAFMSGYDEVKDEEIVILRCKSYMSGGSINTYTGDEMPIITLRLDRLSNKEIIVVSEGTSVSSSTTTYTSTKTYEQ